MKRTEIARFRDKLAGKATPLVSNEALMLMNRVLNWALDEGMLEANPAARLRRAGKAKPRERVLPPADITKLWNALAAMETMTGEHMARAEKGRMLSPATRSIIRLLLLTGQRRSEVAEVEKSELQLGGPEPVWMIPGNRTKNGLLPVIVPMETVEQIWAAIEADPQTEITVDVERLTVEVPAAGITASFPMDPATQDRFINGLDDIGITLVHADAIATYETNRPTWLP